MALHIFIEYIKVINCGKCKDSEKKPLQPFYKNRLTKKPQLYVFVLGHLKLQRLKEKLISTTQKPDCDSGTAREYMGQYLHLLQMFYSNTNWVELHGGTICRDLGMLQFDSSG